MHKPLRRLTAAALLFMAFALQAETHDVEVGNNFFRPNDLTIKVGDTVRWTNNASRNHDVTADDGSWASETSSSFVYERTFESAGEILYHCTVHSAAGRDINTFQNGRITVEEDDSASGVAINDGMTDAWFNPLTNGQGFFIIVWEDSQLIFLSWFTFDSERPADDVSAIFGAPGQRWVTALGGYEGNSATLDVFLSTGGVLDSEEPPVVTDQTPIGTITITWTTCNSATLTYDLPGLQLSGSIPIERIVLDNVLACEAAQESP